MAVSFSVHNQLFVLKYISANLYPLRPTFKHDKGEINKRRIDQKSLGKSQRQQLANACFLLFVNGVKYSIHI